MRAAAALVAVASLAPGAVPTGDHRLMLGAVGQTRQEIEERERETGHGLAAVRVFRRWGETLFDHDQEWARASGHTVFLSIKSRRTDGSPISWHDIATAPPDSPLSIEMRRQAQQIRSFGALVYVVFNHEPDAKTSRPMGTPGDFVAAWRRLIGGYRAAGVRNARYVWTLTGWSFGQAEANGRTRADDYYPGDGYVDDIAADTYNFAGCLRQGGRWQSPAELIDPQRRFGLRHRGKGLMLLEWGSVEDPAVPGRKAQWLREATALLGSPAYRQYRVAVHWDGRYSGVLAGTACDFDYRTSPGALAAWRAMATSPRYAVRSSCAIGDCPARRTHRARRWAIAAAGVPIVAAVAGLLGVRSRRRRRTARR